MTGLVNEFQPPPGLPARNGSCGSGPLVMTELGEASLCLQTIRHGAHLTQSSWNLGRRRCLNRGSEYVNPLGYSTMSLLTGAAARGEFDRFVAASTADLLRTGYLLTWNLTDAEDLVQESLLRTARRWSEVRKMEFPKAYARRVLVNLAIRGKERRWKIRSESIGADSLDVTVDERHEREFLAFETRSDIETALARLPLNQRAVIVLRYYEDLSEREIAELLGWPVGTVKSTASRALDELRHTFAEPVSAPSESSFSPVVTSRGVDND